MIEGIINSIIESSRPAVTKWRTTFLILSMLLCSPNIDSLFTVNLIKIGLNEAVGLVTELLSSSKLIIAALLAFSFYILIPYFVYLVLQRFISFNLNLADSLIKELEKARSLEKAKIEKIISESFDAKKNVADKARKLIDTDKVRCEAAINAVALYIFTASYLGVLSWILFIVFSSLGLLAVYFFSRNILLLYLRDVAPFKILEDYIKYFVMVK